MFIFHSRVSANAFACRFLFDTVTYLTSGDHMRKSVQIVLTLHTWEILGESLLEILPEARDTAIEVIVAPSPPLANFLGQSIDEENLLDKLREMEMRLKARYSHLVFNYENVVEKIRHDALKQSSSLTNVTYPLSWAAG